MLQANVGGSRPAQDLALAAASRVGARIVCLSEPHLFKSSISPTPGWKHISTANIAILVDGSILYKDMKVINESCVSMMLGSICVIGTYLSPNAPVEGLLNVMTNEIGKQHKALILGDFNCRLPWLTKKSLRPRDHEYMTFVLNNGLNVENNTVPTCYHQGRPSINDYTITKNCCISDWRVSKEESLSDHQHIVANIVLDEEMTLRTYKTTNYEGVQEELNDTKLILLPYDSAMNTGINATTVTSWLSDLVSRHTTVRPINSKTKWWNTSLEDIRKEIKKLRRRAQREALDDEEKISLKEVINEKRNELRRGIRQAKKYAWKEFITVERPWGKAYEVIVKNPNRHHPQLRDEVLLYKLSPDLDTIPIEEEAEGDASLGTPPTKYVQDNITPDRVADLLRKCTNRTTPGPDGINYKTLKIVNKTFPDMLAELYSACLKFSVFPEEWKVGRIAWAVKPDKDPLTPDAYRPIALLSNIGKLFEKIIAECMWEHIESNNILSDAQFGFRCGRSTEDAIHTVLNKIKHERIFHKYVSAISLDIAGAFDNITWEHIRKELERFEFPEHIQAIVGCYLKDRIAFSGNHFTWLGKGCPQGSVLGPLLWIVAYNYLIATLKNSGVAAYCYADDTVIIVGGASPESIANSLTGVLANVSEILQKSGLKLNESKTEIVVFPGGDRKIKKNINLIVHFNRCKLKSRNVMKYLGVYIDTGLTFDNHYAYLEDKCTKLLPKLLSICQNCCGYSNESRRIMLKATIGAMYRYACSVFVHRAEANRRSIERIDRKIAQCCGRLYRTVGYYPATVISGSSPLQLDIVYQGLKVCHRKGWPIMNGLKLSLPDRALESREYLDALKKSLMDEWQRRYESHSSQWTRRMVPHVQRGIPEDICFFLAQALSGHGCFRQYRHRIGKPISPKCPCGCGEDETALHVLENCPRFEEGRPDALNVEDPTTCRYMRSVMKKLWAEENGPHSVV